MSGAMPPSTRRPATVLVRGDSRDAPMLRALAARGFRLGGYMRAPVEALRREGLDIGFLDLEGAPATPPAPRQRAHMQGMASRWLGATGHASLAQALGITDRRELGAVQEALLRHVNGNFLAAAHAVDTFNAMAGPENIRLLLLRSDLSHPDRALALAARLRGIPSLHVMHGNPRAALVAAEVAADLAAIYGPATGEWFAQFGIAPGRIAITGNPPWDGLGAPGSVPTREEALTRLKLDPALKTVMFAGTWAGNMNAYDLLDKDWPWFYFLRTLDAIDELRRQEDLQLIFKPHPATTSIDLLARHQQEIETRGVRWASIVGHAEPWQLAHSDVIVCVESNIGIEGMLVNSPVINLRFSIPVRDTTDQLFGADDAVITVTRPEDLPQALGGALFDSNVAQRMAQLRPASVYRHSYLEDGQATARVIQLALRMLDPEMAARELRDGAPASLTASMSDADLASVIDQHRALAQQLEQQGDEPGAAFLRGQAERLAGS